MSDSVASEEGITEKSSLLEHLIELRDRLKWSAIVVGVLFIGLFFYPSAKTIYNWLANPLISQGHEMIIIGTAAPFLIPMKLTLLVAFLIALPYLFYQLWSFVAPGLYKHEKRLIYPLIASSIFLFYLGIAFVYFILLPMMFQIIPQFAPDISTTYSPDIAEYLNFTIMMFLAFGIGFEMPIATILVISTGMTTAEDLKKKRPYVIVGAFVAGMFLTPPDVVSQIMLAVPMWLLFEVGLIFSTIFNIRIKEAGDARKEMDEKNNYSSNSASTAIADTSSAETTLKDDTPRITAKELWEDGSEDSYIYDPDNFVEYQDADSFDAGSSEKTENNENFSELSAEEMDAELDPIKDEEIAKKQSKKTVAKKATKKPTSKKTVAKKPTAKKTATKKPANKKKTDE